MTEQTSSRALVNNLQTLSLKFFLRQGVLAAVDLLATKLMLLISFAEAFRNLTQDGKGIYLRESEVKPVP